MRDRPHHRTVVARGGESGGDCGGAARPRRARAPRSGHPLHAQRGTRRGGACGESPRQSGELRRQEEIRGARVRRRAVGRRGGTRWPALPPFGETLQRTRSLPSHRHEPRFPRRSHHESLWRHTARHGGERARIPRCVRGRGLPRCDLQHEIEQFPGRHPGLPVAGGATRGASTRRSQLPLSRRCHRGGRRRRRPHQERHRYRLAPHRRHRRHHPGVAYRTPGARGSGRGGAGAHLYRSSRSDRCPANAAV